MKRCFYFRKKFVYSCENCVEPLPTCSVVLTSLEDDLKYHYKRTPDTTHVLIDSLRDIPEQDSYERVIQIVCSACQKKFKELTK